MLRYSFLTLFLINLIFPLYGQTARKPSYYDQQSKIGNLLPRSVANQRPTPKITYISSIKDQNIFQQLARTYELGSLYEIPHILFVIDLKNNNHLYYLNTPFYELHENFLQQVIVKKKLTRTELNTNYLSPKRRFLLGTLSWQQSIKQYTYEFWEGDTLSAEQLQLTEQLIKQTFFDAVVFKTNSTTQEQTTKKANIHYFTQQQLIQQQSFLALNQGTAVGKLKLITSEQDLTSLTSSDIIILKETPIALPPVAAIITEQPSTVLSHVNLLAKSWKIPNAYIKNAAEELKQYENQWIELQVNTSNYTIKASEQTVVATKVITVAKTNTNTTQLKLFPLKTLTIKDSIYCGSKAANLGEISHKLPAINIPDGFCIPFGQYQLFMQQHGLFKQLAQLENQPQFKNNSQYRQHQLALFRQQIIDTPIPNKLLNEWVKQWQGQLAGKAIFVRSSSNSEDLPNFSSAGLYTSVANVIDRESLAKAVKTVWASTYNYKAYETRQILRLSDDLIKMSVLIQVAIDTDKAGVMITRDPFNKTRPYITYIAAKYGLGIKVVEGKAIAEQVMYSSWSKAIQVLSLSDEKTALKLAKDGGVVEQPLDSDQSILNEQLIVNLAKIARQIKYLFNSQDQDIEWAVKQGTIFILQSRPYIH
ncbi:hypothetical protein MTZ49_00665 [Entomomonas sp. E2T0]|uniref:PEP/pyruvate-binding domain-containing protein n=1 Tax=Entomomonas sp. E2T0 TaxID=2930213 RepID=UPI00222823CE|nr:PEP/pyruvate-binding domain-containing protein [Entomomonas sp. E2T0]UYZ84135.1 hypothetical protein MTZ49_00665 [Entomomonas sp. E2T0]